MNPQLIYLFVFAGLFLIAVFLQKKYCIICDASSATPKPYSFSRLQLVWWTFLVFAVFITIVIYTGNIPTFDSSTLILLGIGSLTTATSRIIDISDDQNFKESMNKAIVNNTAPPPPLSKDMPRENFWLDILSDKTGVSIHRFQAFVFNLVFGIWFIYQSVKGLNGYAEGKVVLDKIIPIITDNNLILLGLSAGTYAAMKMSENKSSK